MATGALAQTDTNTEIEREIAGSVSRNISSFRTLDWRNYFQDTRNGIILCDLQSRALHFWSEDLSVYRLYPTSVPMTEDLTRRGTTEVVEKVVAPSWRPTPSMRERNPEWPEMIPGGDPGNPLGPLALYLSWTYYRIHGTMTRARSGGVRQTAVSGFTTNTSRNCSILQRSAPRW